MAHLEGTLDHSIPNWWPSFLSFVRGQKHSDLFGLKTRKGPQIARFTQSSLCRHGVPPRPSIFVYTLACSITAIPVSIAFCIGAADGTAHVPLVRPSGTIVKGALNVVSLYNMTYLNNALCPKDHIFGRTVSQSHDRHPYRLPGTTQQAPHTFRLNR